MTNANPHQKSNHARKRRGGKFRSVGEHLAKPAQKLSQKRGFYDLSLLRNWRDMLGEQLAKNIEPLEIKNYKGGRILVIGCVSAYASEITMRSEEIRMRLNAGLGFEAITKVKIAHQHIGFAEKKAQYVPKPRAPKPMPIEIAKQIGAAENEEFRQSLEALCETFYKRETE